MRVPSQTTWKDWIVFETRGCGRERVRLAWATRSTRTPAKSEICTCPAKRSDECAARCFEHATRQHRRRGRALSLAQTSKRARVLTKDRSEAPSAAYTTPLTRGW